MRDAAEIAVNERFTFRAESELVRPVTRWLRRRGLLVREEFHTQVGICDLVGFQLDQERLKQRLVLGQKRPLGPRLRVHLWLLLPDTDAGSSLSLDELAKHYSGLCSEEEIAHSLDQLVAGGLAVRLKPNHYSKSSAWYPLHKEIVAVELKLSRLVEAIAQARRYLGFATSSYVAAPADRARAWLEHRGQEYFRAESVGLLAVRPSRVETLVQCPAPPADLQNEVACAHAVERFFSSFVKGS